MDQTQQQERVANNELIAKFMGWKYRKEEYHPNEFDWFWFEPNKVVNNRHFELRFHESWDWLMPVIKKIGNLPIEYEGQVRGFINSIRNKLLVVDIEGTHKEIVRFIKWYNKNEE